VVWCSIQLSYGRVFRWPFRAQGPEVPHAFAKTLKEVAKARHSYRLRPGLARSDKTVSAGPVALRAGKKSAKCGKALRAYSVFERSGYRFANRASVLIQSEPKRL